METLNRALGRLVSGIETLLALVLIASVLLNCINIAARYFFHYSITGADEVQIYGMVAVTFIGLMVVSWRGRHLRMDVLVRNLSPRAKTVLEVVERLLTLTITLIVLDVSFEYVFRLYQIGITSENVGIPMWIPHSSITIGFALTAVVAIAQIADRCRAVLRGPGKTPPKDGQS
jgi:TRAP-type C4-dicarboxylate transport system permease small subunit